MFEIVTVEADLDGRTLAALEDVARPEGVAGHGVLGRGDDDARRLLAGDFAPPSLSARPSLPLGAETALP